MCLFSRNVAFFAGSVLAVLVVLTVIDEDVLAVEHVLTTMTVAGMCMRKYQIVLAHTNEWKNLILSNRSYWSFSFPLR